MVSIAPDLENILINLFNFYDKRDFLAQKYKCNSALSAFLE